MCDLLYRIEENQFWYVKQYLVLKLYILNHFYWRISNIKWLVSKWYSFFHQLSWNEWISAVSFLLLTGSVYFHLFLFPVIPGRWRHNIWKSSSTSYVGFCSLFSYFTRWCLLSFLRSFFVLLRSLWLSMPEIFLHTGFLWTILSRFLTWVFQKKNSFRFFHFQFQL